MREASYHIADIETLRGGLDPRDDAPIDMPRLRAVARLGVAADRCRACLSTTHPYIVGDGLDQTAEHVVATKAEYEVDAILIAPLHHLWACIVAVAANGDVGMWPVLPDGAQQASQMTAYLLSWWGLAGLLQHRHWPRGRGVIDVDGQEAALIVMRVEHRQLLMAMHDIEGIVDVQRYRGGRLVIAAAIQRHHGPHQPDHLAQARRILATRHGWLRAQIAPAIRQVTAGKFEGGITPQIIEFVGIFVAAGNGQYASAQDVGKRMNNPRRVAPIGDLRSKPVGDSHAPLRQGQQHHAAVRTDAPAIERGGDLLAVYRWQRERQQAIVDHGGCGSVRLGERLASTPKSLRQFSRLCYIRQRIPALQMNKPG